MLKKREHGGYTISCYMITLLGKLDIHQVMKLELRDYLGNSKELLKELPLDHGFEYTINLELSATSIKI